MVQKLACYAAAAAYPADFSARARSALEERDQAAAKLSTAMERRDKLAARIASLAVSQPLVEAEKDVRELSERALHVAKARTDRPNRQREIDEGEAQLASLRRLLQVDRDQDLAEKLPDPAAIEKVRVLAAEAIERAPSLTAVQRRVTEIIDSLAAIGRRITSARQDGADLAVEIAASQFASLAAQKAGLDARRRSVDAGAARLRQGLDIFELPTFTALDQIRCPAPDLVRAEQISRDKIKI